MKKFAFLLIGVLLFHFSAASVGAQSDAGLENGEIRVMVPAADFTATDRGLVVITAPDGSLAYVEGFNGGFAGNKEFTYRVDDGELLTTYTVTVWKTDSTGGVTEERKSVGYWTVISLTASTVELDNVKAGSVLLLASYNGEKIKDIKRVRLEGNSSVTIADTGLLVGEADKICAMVWSGLDTLKPCGQAQSVSLAQ